ncbi:TBC1 domain family member 8 [Heterocephalus glaber]|uniref:TBC1 domain family member 8 n=1 Tax=Heterocephalus glaber TaxID=10181 RepID=G5BTX8_HETGA|nr:TBC1 domain family member 8 [Heterocephalus glaber]
MCSAGHGPQLLSLLPSWLAGRGWDDVIRAPMWLKPKEVLLKSALKLWVTQKSSCYLVLKRRLGKVREALPLGSPGRRSGRSAGLQCTGCPVSDSAAGPRVPGLLSHCMRGNVRGNKPALRLAGAESPPYFVFDNKDNIASFVKGKVKALVAKETSSRLAEQEEEPEKFQEALGWLYLNINQLCFYSFSLGKELKLVIPWVNIQKLERTSDVFLPVTIRITTQSKEQDFSMFLNLDKVFRIMEQPADVTLRRLLDNEVLDLDPELQEPSQIAKRDPEAQAQNEFLRAFFRLPRKEKLRAVPCYIYCASHEDSRRTVVLPLREAMSIKKTEDTSLRPSPTSSASAVRWPVESLLARPKQVHANHAVHCDSSPREDDTKTPGVLLEATTGELYSSKNGGQALMILSRFLDHIKSEDSLGPSISSHHAFFSDDQEAYPVTDIADLIRDSYEKFGDQSMEQIDCSLCCKH